MLAVPTLSPDRRLPPLRRPRLMPKLSDTEIAQVTGRPAPPKKGALNRVEDTLEKLGEMDGRLSDLVQRHRQPGETHEAAASRLMVESPNLYTEYKKAKAEL